MELRQREKGKDMLQVNGVADGKSFIRVTVIVIMPSNGIDALKWETDQPAWNRSGGRGHIIPNHHPWSFKSVRKFVKKAIWLLPDMDSTGNWYKPGQGGKIQSELGTELSGVDGVVIEEGIAGEKRRVAAQNGMRKSIFCLSPDGDTPSSAKLFDVIASGCIPKIVSGDWNFHLSLVGLYFISKALLPLLESDMQNNLVKYSRHSIYSSPAQPLGPEDLVWRMVGLHKIMRDGWNAGEHQVTYRTITTSCERL
ncbi:hypothetical protein QQ045_014553 [Rhodiola kirilowii]